MLLGLVACRVGPLRSRGYLEACASGYGGVIIGAVVRGLSGVGHAHKKTQRLVGLLGVYGEIGG